MQHGVTINYSALSHETKLQILKEMGFREIPPGDHSGNCLSRQGGYQSCDCIPGVTLWGAPLDMKDYLGETHEQRVEFGMRRARAIDKGERIESWIDHLERTAPRYNT